MTIYQKLANVQSKLKCQKSQYNSFGKYHYRSCEDILEGAKPLCIENGLVLTLTDKPLMVGTRIYIEATATVTDVADPAQTIVTTAYAREDENKKGMDGSQITGTASSYARKYALNGLFCIDDTKDDDYLKGQHTTPQNGKQGQKQATQKQSNPKSSQKEPQTVKDYYDLVVEYARKNHAVMYIVAILKEKFHKSKFEELTLVEAKAMYTNLQKLIEEQQKKDDDALMDGVG